MTSNGRHEEASMAGFLDPGLDYATEDLSAEEADRYLAWCARVHGEGDLELVPFAEFFVECDPAGLKYLRRHTAKIGLPIAAAVLMWAHTYCALGSAKGTLYEVIAARELGVTRAQIIDVIRCAGFVAGPYALNAAGELTLPYLRAWPREEKPAARPEWPTTWDPDPDAYAAGIDHSNDDLQPGEYERIADWYAATYGEVPPGIRLAAETNPSAFKLARVRFERIAQSTLPAQLFPLLMVHTGLVQDRPLATRRAVQHAHSLGVSQDVLSRVVHWAAVLGGESTLERGMQILSDCKFPAEQNQSRTLKGHLRKGPTR
jgi:hypothetical protein